MGGSIFFFVESKTFEFLVKEGGTYFMLRIYERNKDSLRSVFMGKESAKRLLTYVEDLLSLHLLISLLEPSGREIRFLFYNWVSMFMQAF